MYKALIVAAGAAVVLAASGFFAFWRSTSADGKLVVFPPWEYNRKLAIEWIVEGVDREAHAMTKTYRLAGRATFEKDEAPVSNLMREVWRRFKPEVRAHVSKMPDAELRALIKPNWQSDRNDWAVADDFGRWCERRASEILVEAHDPAKDRASSVAAKH